MKVVEPKYKEEKRIELEYLELVLSKKPSWWILNIPTIKELVDRAREKWYEAWEADWYYSGISGD